MGYGESEAYRAGLYMTDFGYSYYPPDDEEEDDMAAKQTKQQAIKELVALGCTIVDRCKGKTTVKVIVPAYPNQVAVADPVDLLNEMRQRREQC